MKLPTPSLLISCFPMIRRCGIETEGVSSEKPHHSRSTRTLSFGSSTMRHLHFRRLADIRYSLYHHCSRAGFTVTGVTEDEFELVGRQSTLRIISDSARRYLLWRLR